MGHDGTGWGNTDSWRKGQAGGVLIHGALLEVKGDWKQMWFCFGVPGWMSRRQTHLLAVPPVQRQQTELA